MKYFFIIFLFVSLSAYGQVRDYELSSVDVRLKKVATFPDDYVGQKLIFDKVYVWYRLGKLQNKDGSTSKNYFHVYVSGTEVDATIIKGNLSEICGAVRKSLASKLIDRGLSTEHEFISRITVTIIKSSHFNYYWLSSN